MIPMKQEGEKRSIRAKVIAGFLVLFVLIGAAIFLLLSQSEKTKPLRQAAEVAGKKATLVNGMLSRLMEMDRLARAYFATRAPEYLSDYLQNFDQLKLEIKTLKETDTENRTQRGRIKKVDYLIGKKQEIHEKLFGLKRQQMVDTTTRDTILNIAQQISDTVRTSQTILQVHTIERIPVSIQEKQKENIFKRMWSSITGSKPNKVEISPAITKYETRKDTSVVYSVSRDTSAEHLKNQLIQFRQKELTITQEISAQEKNLQKTDQQIANEIRRLLYRIEQDELILSVERAEQNTEIQNRLYIFSIILGIVALLTILVFSIFIGRDLTRSEYFKRELIAARLVAEEHLRVKEQFLATMSHEIRTPITSIIGFTEQLGQTNLDQKQQTYQSIIANSSEHLLGLVNDILDFSKIEAGMLKLERIPFSPKEALCDAWNLIQQRGVQKGLAMDFSFNFPADLILLGDPLRFRQVLINLLGNAIKFTQHGKVSLKAAGAQVESNKWQLTILVADTGIGIPKEMQESIFKEFTQSDPGVTRKFGGTGLGLAICKRLVEMQGGTINVNSLPSEGAEFLVSLLFEVASEMADLHAPREENKITSLQDSTILLVEDDSITLLLTKSILEKFGAYVITATNGVEGLKILSEQEQRINLLISDVNMPEMSGPELIGVIRKDEKYAKIPALCTSATSNDSDIQQYLKDGFDAVLTKPFYEQELLTKIGLLLGISAPSNENIEEPPITNESISFAAIKKFIGDENEAFNEILQSLLDNLQQVLEEIPVVVERNDQKQLAELAHKLLPHFRQVGLKEGALILSEIEKFRKENTDDLTFFNEQSQLFQKQIKILIAAIRTELA